MPYEDGGFMPDDTVIRWRDCPDCKGRGWFLIRPFKPNLGICDMTQCGRCKAEYEKHQAAAAA